jgi:hypothetical protein
MKINHLVPNIDGTNIYVLTYLKAEPAIEGKHRFGVLHWECNMIEATDGSGASSPILLLCPRLEYPSRYAPSDSADHESTPGRTSEHCPPQVAFIAGLRIANIGAYNWSDS